MNKIITQKICKNCNKEYTPGRRNSDYCGIICFNKSRIGSKHPIGNETRKKISETLKGKGIIPKSIFKDGHLPWNKNTHGLQISWCKGKKKNICCGKTHWNWKGGITSEQEKLRKSIESKNWRRLIFIRDDFTCQYCKQIGGKLRAHHIKLWSKYPDLRFEIENGITLCEFCHKEIHKNYKLT